MLFLKRRTKLDLAVAAACIWMLAACACMGQGARPDWSQIGIKKEDIKLPIPKAKMDGLQGFAEPGMEIDEEEAELEMMEFLDPGSRDRMESELFRKNNSIYQIVYGQHEKNKAGQYYFDARCKAARDLGDFIEDKVVRDILFECGVKVYFCINPFFVPTAINSFLRSGTNELPRMLYHLKNGINWTVRGRMASILYRIREQAPDVIQEALIDAMCNDPSEDVRGPVAVTIYGSSGKNKVSPEFEKLAVERLYVEDNTLVKYILAWSKFYSAHMKDDQLKHLDMFRDLIRNGKWWENRWFGLEAMRVARYARDPEVSFISSTTFTNPVYEAEVAFDIARVVTDDPDPRMRFCAIETLYYYTNGVGVKVMCRSLREDKDPDVRGYAARMLGIKANTIQRYPWIDRYPKIYKEFTALKQRRALSEAERKEVFRAFEDGLKDEDPFVRYYCIRGLGRMGEQAALKILKGIKSDPEEWVMEEVAVSIGLLESPPSDYVLGGNFGF